MKIYKSCILKSALLIFLPLQAIAFCKPLAVIDVYGTTLITPEAIKKSYLTEITHIALNSNNKDLDHPGPAQDQYLSKMKRLVEYIRHNGNFAFISIFPIRYDKNPTVYITIDLVEKRDKKRLSYYLPAPNKHIPDPSHLIDNMIAYERDGATIAHTEKRFPTYKHCPAHHCLFGFEEPALKKYQPIFARAELAKTRITDVLKHDKDEKRRAAAAYLLGHINDYHETAQLLLPTINDPSSIVRNNSMRVIGEIVRNHKDISIPIRKIITALDFPTASDRNKALAIIDALAENPKYHADIIKHASYTLLKILPLAQPNNHDFAYSILKKISHRNYDEHDYHAWTTWVEYINNASYTH